MRGPDRTLRFAFESAADAYASGRPELPLDAVREAATAVRLPPGARVLEVGAGTGQLTGALLAAGMQVVALEPGDALRALAERRFPDVLFEAATFEEFEPDRRFDAIFSSNAWHWIDPAVGVERAADTADALVLLWDTPFVADAARRRQIQTEVMIPHGSEFPSEEPEIRRLVAEQLDAASADVVATGRFEELWRDVRERRLVYTSGRYVDLVGSMSSVVASDDRAEVLDGLRRLLGEEPFEVVDLVWTVAARAKAS